MRDAVPEILFFSIMILVVVALGVLAGPILGCWFAGGYISQWVPWPECLGVGLA